MSSNLEIDVVGPEDGPLFLPLEEIDRLLSLALASAGIESGHVAVEFVDAARIAELNAEWRGKDGPTDVLSFPVDGAGATAGPRELGDLAQEPLRATDREARGEAVADAPAGRAVPPLEKRQRLAD